MGIHIEFIIRVRCPLALSKENPCKYWGFGDMGLLGTIVEHFASILTFFETLK